VSTRFEPDDGTEEPEPEQPNPEQPAPDEPEQPEPDTEPDTEQQEVLAVESAKRVEKIGKQLDTLRDHISKRLDVILGADAEFYIPCELCTPFRVPGWRPPVELPVDVQNALWTLLGQKTQDNYRDDPHTEECVTCGGEGVVKTRSKVDGQRLLPCVECNALGWLPTDPARSPSYGRALNGADTPSEPVAPFASVVPDLSMEELAEIDRLKQLGYAVIPPYQPTA
jgi:hypothetical protein